MQPDDLAPSVGVDGHGDYRGHRDDPAALADLEVGRVEPEVGPLALQGAPQEGADALVDVATELGDARLRDAAHAHGLHQVVDLARGHPGDPGLLDHRDQRLLHRLAGLEEAREVRAGPELRDPKVQRSQPGLERPVAVAVAPGGSLGRALVAPGSNEALDVGLHDDLKHALGDGAEEVLVATLRQELGQR